MKSTAVSVALLRHKRKLEWGGAEDAIENAIAKKVRTSKRIGNEVLRQRSIASANEMKKPIRHQLLMISQVF